MKKIITCLFVFLIISACGKQIPEPQAVKAATIEKHQALKVNHIVRDTDILIECQVPNIDLNAQNTNHQAGKIKVFINGKLYKQYDTAAFIVRNVNPGTHHFVVEVVKLNDQPTGLKAAFSATIK